MIEIKSCPSSLVEGFDTYSPKSAKLLFGKTKVNPILGFDIDEFRNDQVCRMLWVWFSGYIV